MSKYDREYQACRREKSQRGLYLYLAVLFTTACWAAMLYFGGKTIGVPIATGWLLAFAGVIFVLLLLGLAMAAVASGNSGEDERALLFDPPGPPIALVYHPGCRSPWKQAGHKELRCHAEQSWDQDG